MIFAFSAQDALASSRSSDPFVQFLIRHLHPDFDQLSSSQRYQIYQRVQYLVRKTAHFSEFALLGVFLHLLLRALRLRRSFVFSWVIGTLYACTDEWHQMLTGSRSAMWQDVCIDSFGVLFGGLMAVLLCALVDHRRKKGAKKPK